MKKIGLIVAAALILIPFAMPLQAQLSAAQELSSAPGLVLGQQAVDSWDSPTIFGKGKKKKRKKNTLAVGAVIGGPVGFGGRVVFRPTRLAIAADIAYNRVRTDLGPLVGSVALKADARLYSKGLISKLLRPYIFGGVTMQRGDFDPENISMESVYALDAGIGGGIKLFRLEINGEVGIMAPWHQPETFRPGLDLFANIGILFWLL